MASVMRSDPDFRALPAELDPRVALVGSSRGASKKIQKSGYAAISVTYAWSSSVRTKLLCCGNARAPAAFLAYRGRRCRVC